MSTSIQPSTDCNPAGGCPWDFRIGTTALLKASAAAVGGPAGSPFQLNAELHRAEYVLLYVSTGPNGDQTVPSLYRMRLQRNGTALGDAEELARGIENLQLRFGVDAAPYDGQVDTPYKTADEVAAGTAGPFLDLKWSRVLSVQIGVLVRSPERAGVPGTTPDRRSAHRYPARRPHRRAGRWRHSPGLRNHRRIAQPHLQFVSSIMTTRPASCRPLPQRPRGAVLFVALIMLLLLTLLGVTAAQVTVMQERMSGNFRVQQLAFERSESALAAGRDTARDPLQAYDTISDVPRALGPSNSPPWNSWLPHSSSVEQSETSVRACGGACAQRLGSAVGEDPNRKPRYYIITAQEKDLPSADAETAAWATNQTVYVF